MRPARRRHRGVFSESHLFYWIGKISNIVSGSIDELDLEKKTLPILLGKIQYEPLLTDIKDARKYIREIKDSIAGLEKMLLITESEIRLLRKKKNED